MSGSHSDGRPGKEGMRGILQDFPHRLPLVRRGLGMVWEAAPGWTIVWGMLLTVQGLLPAALVDLTRTVVDRLATFSSGRDGSRSYSAVLVPAGLIAVLWMLGQALSSLTAWVRTAQAELVQDHIQSTIHRQAMSLDLAFFEVPHFYDLMHRARLDALQQPLALLENVGLTLQNGLSVLTLAALLVVRAPVLPVLLAVSALPGLWVVARYTWREQQWRVRNTVNERRARYYDLMFTERGSAAEMRLFDLGEYYQDRFEDVRRRLRSGRRRLAGDQFRAELAAGGIAWAGVLGGMAWMMVRVVRGACGLGDLVMAYQALQQGQKLMRSLMESAGRIYRNLLFLENLFEFLSLEPQIADPAKPAPVPSTVRSSIRFDGVTFGYPGSTRPALEEFSLTLAAGRMTAIVGENGAGKSTLIKLLCRFYDPREGRILLDGGDLRTFSAKDLRQKITVLFQEPVHYHATAGENIAMGDLTASPSGERIQIAARAAGADRSVMRLPQGYESVLGKWFGGAELSVGEWQRLALARAFLRNAAIVALDEPTSAMDTWAEADWLNRLRKITEGRTVLVITHRFTTAMRADTIHVMEKGRIVESGNHAALVASGGRYAQSWQQQMEDAAHV